MPSIARWAIHTQPIRGCDALIAKLEAIVSRYSDKVILTPYPKMDTQIALTAWGWIDTFDAVDEQRIVGFIQAYRGIDHHPRR